MTASPPLSAPGLPTWLLRLAQGLRPGRREGPPADDATRDAAAPGRVSLVGCGPGDPELLTLKALRLIRGADVLLHDRLIHPSLLAEAPRRAVRLYVGKRCGRHAVPQAEICQRLVALARSGRHVVRLKGGDPFIFGRGGEELAACRAAGIPCEVIPGVTAASGCAASAGIPLTHRGTAQAVTFVTGHGEDGNVPALDWAAVAGGRQTVVFYMGLGRLPALQAALLAGGIPADLPLAVIRDGTLPTQRIERWTLGDADPVPSRGEPVLLVLGEVVNALAALPQPELA